MFFILFLILLASLVYMKIIKPYSYWPNKGVKQRTQTYLLGDIAAVIFGRETFLETLQKLYGAFPQQRYVGMYQLLKPTLFLKDPDLIKQITVKDFDHFVDHTQTIPEDVDPILSRNLVILKGDRWRDIRTTLSPSFTASKMKVIFGLVSECAVAFNAHFLERNEEIVTLELKDTFTRYTNDVIATVAFGLKCDSLKEPKNSFYMTGRQIANFTGAIRVIKNLLFRVSPRFAKTFGLSFISPQLTNYFHTIIKDTVKIREEQSIIRPDMLNLLIEVKKRREKQEEHNNDLVDTGFATVEESTIDGGHSKFTKKPITDLDITAQALIFFLAGFETISNFMSFLGYELIVNQDVQTKLQKEIDDTLEECEGTLTYEALMKMKYMDMVVSEVLRKWPPAMITDRACVKPYTIQPISSTEKPVYLDVGDTIWLPIIAIQRDSKYFPNPDVFDPERFSDANKVKIRPCTYFPFGSGPRSCIGSRFALLEIKIISFHLLSQFNLVAVEKTQIPLKLSKKSLAFSVENGIWVGLKARRN